jgi:hypothetical protein
MKDVIFLRLNAVFRFLNTVTAILLDNLFRLTTVDILCYVV